MSAKLDTMGHRCVPVLETYTFSINYRYGKEHLDADALSRMPGLASNTDEYNEITLCDMSQLSDDTRYGYNQYVYDSSG